MKVARRREGKLKGRLGSRLVGWAWRITMTVGLLWGYPGQALSVAPQTSRPGIESGSVGPTRSVEQAESEPTSWLPVQSFDLANGVKFYVVRRPFSETVSAGWVVRAGGADDARGHTGVAHLVEHLLFQGSETVGTKDWLREKELFAAEELLEKAIQDRASGRKAKARDLEAVRRNLRRVQRPGELAKLWAEGSIQGTGALTTKDFSFYTGSFPKERLEAWMWLEVDRLAKPAMRGMQREKGVVAEESLQRVAGVNQGSAEVAFDAFFWGQSPYALSTDGVPGEMEASTRSDALAFHRTHYRPDNIAVALVGDVDVGSVRALAERYFGHLTRVKDEPGHGESEWGLNEPGGTRRLVGTKRESEPATIREREFAASPEGSVSRDSCACRPSVRIRFPTVRYGHPDAVALDVLAAVLNGRSGRLFRNVVGRQPAFAAYATHKAQARAGSFSLVAEAHLDAEGSGQGAAVLERLQVALLVEVERLLGENGMREVEVRRARNMLRAQAAREVKASDSLRTRLLIDDALGDGTRLRNWSTRLERVTLHQLERIVDELLDSERGVTFYLEGDRMAGMLRSGSDR